MAQTDYLQQYAASAIVEDATMTKAREHADDLNITSVTPATGAVLSVLSGLSGGNAVVEVGTGAGISGLWLLSGMPRNGILTTIDNDPDLQQAARENFTRAGITSERTRLINGWAEEVLPRLSDQSYDLVFIDVLVNDVARLLDNTVRIIRPGGGLVINVVAAGAEKATGFSPEQKTFALQSVRLIAENELLIPAIVPIGTGLLIAIKDHPRDKRK